MPENFFLKWFRDIRGYLVSHRNIILGAGLVIALNWELFTLWNMPLFCDEGDHLLKIHAARSGDFSTVPYLAMFPVYHGLMGVILNLLNATTLAQIRFVTFLGSLCTIAIFFLLTERLWPADKLLRTAQFVFLPIVFPFLPLIYTDIWALGFALLTVERSLAGRPSASAIAAFIAAMLRTSNIVWGLLAWILLIYAEGSSSRISSQRIMMWIKSTWLFVLLFLGFSVFVICNNGAAIGDKHNQPITLNISNVWFFLFIFFFTFMPTCLCEAKAFLLLKHKFRVASMLILISICYFYTYAAHHPYNQPGLWLYLRNRLLYWTTTEPLIKCITLIPVLLALNGLVFAPLVKTKLRWLIPFAFASIVFTPIIEQRYYLEAFAFFQVFRKSQSLRWELVSLVSYILLSIWLVNGIASQRFFL